MATLKEKAESNKRLAMFAIILNALEVTKTEVELTKHIPAAQSHFLSLISRVFLRINTISNTTLNKRKLIPAFCW